MTKISKKTRQRKRQYAYFRGRFAETVATLFLRLKGYHIVARGFRRPVGEIDIIARRGGVLIAIEVKQRQSLEKALQAIHAKQRRRVSRAMEAFIVSRPEFSHMDIRFDILLITSFFSKPVHLENAW
ncbi:MAG: YraN family protein [Sneathiella sp.]|nr:YraN family protein [Sneathiella sp.]